MKDHMKAVLNEFDYSFDEVRREFDYPDASLIGGMYTWFLGLSHYYYYCYFFVANNRLFYTFSGGDICEVSLDRFRKLKIKPLKWGKRITGYHLKFISDKKYHFVIYNAEWIFTKKTGVAKDNCEKITGFLLSIEKQKH